MKKLKDNCFNEFDPNALSIEEALSNILKTIKVKSSTENVQLKNSCDRILARDIRSKIDVPNYKNSAMDGYAINVNDFSNKNKIFKCVGESFAGNSYTKAVKPNHAIKVMTGGNVPNSCNAVVMKELVELHKDEIKVLAPIVKDQNIRFPGEDIKKNEIVLTKGKRINEIDIGILASLGIASVPVFKMPLIGFISTGDELVSIKKKIKKNQVYDSNRYLLHGLLRKYPVEVKDYGVVKDKLSSIEKKFNEASKKCDVLITTGGVSVGDADHVKTALENLGKIKFWKISVKPGRPLAYGKINKCTFFGLPGNPVSVIVTFNLFVNAAINKLCGKNYENHLLLEAELIDDIKKRKGRTEYKRGILINKDNKLFVKKSGAQGSNILSSLKDANCYIKLDSEIDNLKKGMKVKVMPLALSSKYYE